MLRIVTSAVRGIAAKTNAIGLINVTSKQYLLVQSAQQKYFGALSSVVNRWNNINNNETKPIFSTPHVENVVPPPVLPITTPTRTVIKFSLRKGKRKTVKTVLKRFYRLNWGIWIRTRAGRDRKMWRKSAARKRRLRQHVFVNATQSTLLDKMVTKYWKRPHYYVNDPYNPYHKREEFLYTRKAPLPLK
ncbi:mitochondrial ribosomal protein L35 [Calliopsis andreniformis]|uniref:mitochondrial ribosomal protein L35 n=1 Tax=Calliopsis andreniformis TaxID=337506 RepID=UPI003FCCA6EF